MKDTILHTINTQLPQQLLALIAHYEQQIEQLEDKLCLLQDENERLMDQLELLSDEAPFMTADEKKLQTIAQWLTNCQAAAAQSDRLQLQQLEQAMPTALILSMTKKMRIRALHLLLDQLATSTTKIDTTVLACVHHLHTSDIANDVRTVLINEFEFVLANVEQSAAVHALLVAIFTDFHLQQVLLLYTKRLLETPLHANLSNEQLLQLFWLAFSANLEDTFIERCSEEQRLALKGSKLSPYYVYNKGGKIQQATYTLLTTQLKKAANLPEALLHDIIAKLHTYALAGEALVRQKKAQQVPHVAETKLYIIKDADVEACKQHFSLQRREIMTNAYPPSGQSSKQKIKALFHAFVNPKQTEAFISESAFHAQKQQLAPYLLMGSTHYYHFNWPSTDVQQGNGAAKSDINRKEKSDLRLLGYQVSTLSRAQRWPILQKAVQQLGLYKVAWIITMLIRDRKRMENGSVIYARAISEWEHDLHRLKMVYYKPSMRWPD